MGGKKSLAVDIFTVLCGKVWEKTVTTENKRADLLDLNPFGQPTFSHFKTLILLFHLFY